MAALRGLLTLLGLLCGVLAEADFCRFTHRIESFLVTKQDTYLVEFEHFLLQYKSKHEYRLYEKPGPGQFKVCGNAQVECDQANLQQGASMCEVYIFFDRNAHKFQFALVSELLQVVNIIGNDSDANKYFGYETKNKMFGALADKLKKLNCGQRTLLAFNPATSMFYILDGTRQRLHQWQTHSGSIQSLSSIANRCSALFFLSGQNQLNAVLSGLETLFVLQEDKLFKPIDHNIKQLIGCRMQLASRSKIQNVSFYLSLVCFLCLLGCLVALCTMFIIMERMYSKKFHFAKRIHKNKHNAAKR